VLFRAQKVNHQRRLSGLSQSFQEGDGNAAVVRHPQVRKRARGKEAIGEHVTDPLQMLVEALPVGAVAVQVAAAQVQDLQGVVQHQQARELENGAMALAAASPNRVLAQVQALDADVGAERAQQRFSASAADAVLLKAQRLQTRIHVNHLE